MAWSIFKQGGGPLVAKGWAEQFLTRLGAPVTPGNLQFVYQWEVAEGGGGKYNPLNQGPVKGKPNLTTTGEQFGGGAADFASWDAGLEGAVDFLHYNYYKGVLNGLLNNDPVAARNALWASPWAAGHYGYGSNWPQSTVVPGGTAILPTSAPLAGALVGGAGASTSDATLTNSADPNCVFGYSLTGLDSVCLLNKSGLRSVLGVFVMTVGIGVGLVGVILLSVYGLSQSRAGTAIVNGIPGGSRVARYVS